jgi:hypothetical protein
MAQAAALEAVDLWTRVRWRRGLHAAVTEEPAPHPGPQGDRRLALRTAETTVHLPVEARGGVHRLLAGEVLAVAELAGGDDGVMQDSQRLEIARALLRAAVAVPAEA